MSGTLTFGPPVSASVGKSDSSAASATAVNPMVAALVKATKDPGRLTGLIPTLRLTCLRRIHRWPWPASRQRQSSKLQSNGRQDQSEQTKGQKFNVDCSFSERFRKISHKTTIRSRQMTIGYRKTTILMRVATVEHQEIILGIPAPSLYRPSRNRRKPLKLISYDVISVSSQETGSTKKKSSTILPRTSPISPPAARVLRFLRVDPMPHGPDARDDDAHRQPQESATHGARAGSLRRQHRGHS